MEKGKSCYLTTVDNKFDKMKEYDEWLKFDTDPEHPYYTDSYLAHVVRLNDSMSPIEIENEYERAIDEIIKYDFRKIYKKVYFDLPQEDIEDDENESIDDILNSVVWGGLR